MTLKEKKIKIIAVQLLFNKAIIERDGKCVICGKTSGLQCSHFYTVGAHSGLRFDPRNAHAMCAGCHLKHHNSDPLMYAKWMQENRPDDLAHITGIKNKPIRYSQAWLGGVRHIIKERLWNDLVEYLGELRG